MFNAGPGPLQFSVDPSSRLALASLGPGNDVQWGTVTPVFGSIPAQQQVSFILSASSVLLPPGSFGSSIVIRTNQPSGSQPSGAPIDQPISLSTGQSFTLSWTLEVVQAIAFPAQVNTTLYPYQHAVTASVSVANFAGAALVLASSSNVSWAMSDGNVLIAPAGSVATFRVVISYPAWANSSLVGPGTNLSTSIAVECWRVDETAVSRFSIPAASLAGLLNVSTDNLPGFPFFSPISLNPVTISVSTVIGPPKAAVSTAQLLSPPSISVNIGAGIRISLHMRDAGGYSVLPSDDVIGLVGLESEVVGNSTFTYNFSSVVSVTSVVVSADNSSFIINAQPLALGTLRLNVTLNSVVVGSPITVTVFTAHCRVNETAVNGLTCACSAGHYYNDSTHCLPCPAGSFKPLPSNTDQSS